MIIPPPGNSTDNPRDPVAELTRLRRQYRLARIRSLLYLATSALLLTIDFSQNRRLQQAREQLVADGHALANLLAADRKLGEACIPLISPAPETPAFRPSAACHQEGDLLVCSQSGINFEQINPPRIE